MTCAICLQSNNASSITLSCGHRFHSKCLSVYEHISIMDNSDKPITCPYCRGEYSHIAHRTRNNIITRKQVVINELLNTLNKINNSKKIEKYNSLYHLYITLNSNIHLIKYFNQRFKDVVIHKTNTFKDRINDIELDDETDFDSNKINYNHKGNLIKLMNKFIEII